MRDFAVFVPFLMRGGMVRMLITLDRTLMGIEMNSWYWIAGVLESGGGEVVMRHGPTMLAGFYWVHLKLRSG